MNKQCVVLTWTKTRTRDNFRCTSSIHIKADVDFDAALPFNPVHDFAVGTLIYRVHLQGELRS